MILREVSENKGKGVWFTNGMENISNIQENLIFSSYDKIMSKRSEELNARIKCFENISAEKFCNT